MNQFEGHQGGHQDTRRSQEVQEDILIVRYLWVYTSYIQKFMSSDEAEEDLRPRRRRFDGECEGLSEDVHMCMI